MTALLPLLALAAGIAVCRRAGLEWRRAALAGAVAWGVVTVVLTELLSLPEALGRTELAVAWGAVLVAATVVWQRLPRRPAATVSAVRELDRGSWPLVAGIGLVLLGTLVTGLAAAPNNYDSMTYHLSRVEHWVQNASVAHYPTHNLRQIYFTPLAEWLVLHLRLLEGGDRLANLPQWLAFLGAILGVSVLADELGVGRRGQLLSAAFAATVPMAILQASSTQNDAVAAFFLVAGLAFALPLGRRTRLPDLLPAAAGVGLSALAKMTGVLCALPLLAWIGLRVVARERLAALRWAVLFGVVALTLDSGHWLRNLELFGHPLGSQERHDLTNGDPGLPVLYSNALRNTAIHLQTPWERANAAIEGTTRRLHRLFGLGVDLPETSYTGLRFALDSRWREENNSGAPVHTLLLLGALVAVAVRARDPGARPLALYAGTLVGGFLLYSLLVRWQPTQVRLLLPLLLLWAPVVGAVLGRRRWRRPATVLLTLVAALHFPCVVANQTRPLIGPDSVFTTPRIDQYFASRDYVREPILHNADRILASGCRRVGLASRANSYEYPLWVRLRQGSAEPLRLEHWNVRNESTPLVADRPEFHPCAILKTSVRHGNDRLHLR